MVSETTGRVRSVGSAELRRAPHLRWVRAIGVARVRERARELEAYKTREGAYPTTIEIPRYDPQTMRVVKIETYTPADFLPANTAGTRATGR